MINVLAGDRVKQECDQKIKRVKKTTLTFRKIRVSAIEQIRPQRGDTFMQHFPIEFKYGKAVNHGIAEDLYLAAKKSRRIQPGGQQTGNQQIGPCGQISRKAWFFGGLVEIHFFDAKRCRPNLIACIRTFLLKEELEKT